MSKPSDPPCQKEACALQVCLSKNTYHPEKCEGYTRKLYECCAAMYASGEVKESSACPIESAVKRWLEAHPPSGKKS